MTLPCLLTENNNRWYHLLNENLLGNPNENQTAPTSATLHFLESMFEPSETGELWRACNLEQMTVDDIYWMYYQSSFSVTSQRMIFKLHITNLLCDLLIKFKLWFFDVVITNNKSNSLKLIRCTLFLPFILLLHEMDSSTYFPK